MAESRVINHVGEDTFLVSFAEYKLDKGIPTKTTNTHRRSTKLETARLSIDAKSGDLWLIGISLAFV